MNTLYPHCAGLDVHKTSVFACVRHALPGGQVRQEVRTFATTTDALLGLADWLRAEGVTHVALESTGVYWKPVFHILEESCTVVLVNAQHIKAVPGRKTDVKDCQWIAQLLQHGLLKASFVPPAPIRELRDLTRHRSQLVGEKTRAANRLQKALEDANIKLASVASDILGKSGRAMLRALIAGETDPEKLADLAQRRLRGKIPALRAALHGRVTDHHRFLLKLLLSQVEQIEDLLQQLEERIAQVVVPFAEPLRRLRTVSGIGPLVAVVLLAELGATPHTTFPSAAHLASWAGLCPGNHRSAGRQKHGRTGKGSRWLRAALIQAAWAAVRQKNGFLPVRFRRLARRQGKKKAVLGIAHRLLEIIYAVQRDGKEYEDLGADYYDHQGRERLTEHLVKRLESLGHKVSLEPESKAG
jgi:transposase